MVQESSTRMRLLMLGGLCLCFAGLIDQSNAKVLGIDFGSENIKVAIVQPGRVPISMVTNEMSRRRSPGAVGFVNGERLLGEEAIGMEGRYPDKVFTKMRELLGQPASNPSAASLLKKYYLPYELVEDPERKTIMYKTTEGDLYSVEDLVAMVLHYVKTIGQAYGQGDIRDVVITVPAFFGQGQRAMLLQAADLAGLNVLSLVSEHAAVALQWGIDKEFVNNTQEVIFYDLGAGSAVASLVQFSSFKGKEFGKVKTFGQFEVKAVTWDETIGVSDLDMILVEHFADEFNKKLKGDDVRKYPKSMAKLRKQCKKTKEILSANNAAPMSVEGLHNDMDFRSSITREKFAEMIGPSIARMVKPLKDLLDQTGVDLAKVEAVEMLGGGTRIPAVLDALTAVLGRLPDRHMDSDEAVALGAGLHAANLSTAFRVRKFGAVDVATYGLSVHHSGEAAEESTEEEAEAETEGTPVASGEKKMNLLPRFKKIPVKRVVSLSNVTSDTKLVMSYDDVVSPTGLPTQEIVSYVVSGMEEVAAKWTVTGKVNVQFAVDSSGIMSLAKAEAIIELPDLPPPVKNATKKNVTKTNATKEEGQEPKEGDEAKEEAKEDAKEEAKEGEEATEEEAREEEAKEEEPKEEEPKEGEETKEEEEAKEGEEKKERKKKRTSRIPLNVTVVAQTVPMLSEEKMAISRELLAALHQMDLEKAAAAEAKNSLESFIISTREKVQYEDSMLLVTTEEQREELLTELTEAEDWLYMDGENANTTESRRVLRGLKAKSDPMFERLVESKDRPAAVDAAKKFVDVTRQVVAAWNQTKPWINETHKVDLLAEVDLFEKWLGEKEAAQAEKSAHEDPAFKAKLVYSRVHPLETTFVKLKKTPKPKPPVVKTNATDVNATDTNATAAKANVTAEAEGEAEPADVEVGDDEEVTSPPLEEEEEAEEAEEEEAASNEGAGEESEESKDEL